MNRLRGAAGFTLLELIIVLAIVGVLSAFAVPSFARYRNQEEAKEFAARAAAGLREARTLAMKTGVPHFIVFNPDPATLMRIVRDNDGDYQEDAGELVRNVTIPQLESSQVSVYNATGHTPPFGTGARVPGDLGTGSLASVAGGVSFPIGPTSLPSVGFTTRGVPVPVDNPANLGGAAGAIYVTDNNNSVYAAVVGGLGEIRVRTYAAASDTWR